MSSMWVSIYIIAIYLSFLETTGCLSVLEERKYTIPRRVRSNDKEHGDTAYGSERTAYFKTNGKREGYSGCETDGTWLGVDEESSRRPTPLGQRIPRRGDAE